MFRALTETNVHETFAPSRPAPGTEGGASSLRETASKEILKELSAAVEGERGNSFFTCGGTIAVAEPAVKADEPKAVSFTPSESSPISLYWMLNNEKGPQKVTFPSKDTDPSTLDQLVEDCAPATFGLGDKDVLDPTYRRAGKLDTDCFSTSFHPADFGILDLVKQVLLPTISTPDDNELYFRCVRAELYKLNVSHDSPTS